MTSRRSPAGRWATPILALGAVLGSPALVPATASAAPAVYAQYASKHQVKLPLMPGVLVGHINPYVVKRGDTLAWIAARFGVHPLHVTRPSAKQLRDGMHRGQTIYVDQRRVQPAFKADTTGIVLNLPEAEVYYVENGNLQRAYPVAVSNADWKAPIGETRVVDMEKNPTWYIPKKIQDEMKKRGLEPKDKVDPGPNNPLGVRWIGWADGSYGFHGTTVPTSIKHYASHGCVRFLRDDIIDLYSRVHVGTAVHVYYQPVTLAVDHGNVWISVFPDYYGLGFDFRSAVKALAYEAGVLDRVQWKQVESAFKDKDGTVTMISKPLATPKPHPSASPSAKPSGSPKPGASAKPHPSAHPSGKPSTHPSAAPSAEASPSAAPSVAPASALPSHLPSAPAATPSAANVPFVSPSGTTPR